jgi:hypothetical protein
MAASTLIEARPGALHEPVETGHMLASAAAD